MVYIKFLGTCGGRFATIFQTRSTGGIYLSYNDTEVVIDPGPGSLVRLHQENIDAINLDAVLVSHCHIDHSNDAAILCEAMTKGSTRKSGMVLASPTTLKGINGSGPMIPSYYRKKLLKVMEAKAESKYKVGELLIEATKSVHSDPTSVGFIFRSNDGSIGYISDTEFFPQMKDIYRNCRVLILSTTRPRGARIKMHLSTEDTAELVSQVQPELAILTHFGLKTLNQDPSAEANWIKVKTGIRTIAAEDSMSLMVGDDIDIIR